jgi:hypothetical protein
METHVQAQQVWGNDVFCGTDPGKMEVKSEHSKESPQMNKP